MAPRPPSSRTSRLEAFLAPEGRDGEAVHDLHRDLRHDRFEGQILARIVGAPRGDRSVERLPLLRELERVLGRWRDLELTRELARSARADPSSPAESRWFHGFERTLDSESQSQEERAVRTTRAIVRRPALRPAGAAPGRTLRRVDAPARWKRELASRRRRYLKALDRLDGPIRAEPAHAFRQEIRRLGVFYALLAATSWADPPRRSAKVGRALERLGRVHDIDRALARLRSEPVHPVRDALMRKLRLDRKRAVARARRWVDAGAVRRYAQGTVRRKR